MRKKYSVVDGFVVDKSLPRFKKEGMLRWVSIKGKVGNKINEIEERRRKRMFGYVLDNK